MIALRVGRVFMVEVPWCVLWAFPCTWARKKQIIIIKRNWHEVVRKCIQKNLGVDMMKYVIYMYAVIKCFITFKADWLFMCVPIIEIIFNKNIRYKSEQEPLSENWSKISRPYTKKVDISRRIILGSLLIIESGFKLTVKLL